MCRPRWALLAHRAHKDRRASPARRATQGIAGPQGPVRPQGPWGVAGSDRCYGTTGSIGSCLGPGWALPELKESRERLVPPEPPGSKGRSAQPVLWALLGPLEDRCTGDLGPGTAGAQGPTGDPGPSGPSAPTRRTSRAAGSGSVDRGPTDGRSRSAGSGSVIKVRSALKVRKDCRASRVSQDHRVHPAVPTEEKVPLVPRGPIGPEGSTCRPSGEPLATSVLKRTRKAIQGLICGPEGQPAHRAILAIRVLAPTVLKESPAPKVQPAPVQALHGPSEAAWDP